MTNKNFFSCAQAPRRPSKIVSAVLARATVRMAELVCSCCGRVLRPTDFEETIDGNLRVVCADCHTAAITIEPE